MRYVLRFEHWISTEMILKKSFQPKFRKNSFRKNRLRRWAPCIQKVRIEADLADHMYPTNRTGVNGARSKFEGVNRHRKFENYWSVVSFSGGLDSLSTKSDSADRSRSLSGSPGDEVAGCAAAAVKPRPHLTPVMQRSSSDGNLASYKMAAGEQATTTVKATAAAADVEENLLMDERLVDVLGKFGFEKKSSENTKYGLIYICLVENGPAPNKQRYTKFKKMFEKYTTFFKTKKKNFFFI